MLKTCSGGALVDYVFDFELYLNSSRRTSVQQIYPEKECDESVKKTLIQFVNPNTNRIESRTFFNMVLGDINTDLFYHSFVLYKSSKCGRILLSKYYYPHLFYKVLVSNGFNDFNSLNVEGSDHVFSFGGTDFLLDGSDEQQHVLKSFFSTFKVDDILQLVIGLLESRHIFMISQNSSIVSRHAAVIPLIIKPFRWNFNILPLIPNNLNEMTNSPVPIAIGITDSRFLTNGRLEKHVVVNFDTKMIYGNPRIRFSRVRQDKIVAFSNAIEKELLKWSGCFNHRKVLKLLTEFIYEMVTPDDILSKDVRSKEVFIRNMEKLPESLRESQILEDVKRLNTNEVPEWLKQDIQNWLDVMVCKKSVEYHGTTKDDYLNSSRNTGGSLENQFLNMFDMNASKHSNTGNAHNDLLSFVSGEFQGHSTFTQSTSNGGLNILDILDKNDKPQEHSHPKNDLVDFSSVVVRSNTLNINAGLGPTNQADRSSNSFFSVKSIFSQSSTPNNSNGNNSGKKNDPLISFM